MSESVQDCDLSRQTGAEQKCSTQAQSVGPSEQQPRYQQLRTVKRDSVQSSKHTAYEDKPQIKRYAQNVPSTQDNSFGAKMTRSSSQMQYNDERSKKAGVSRLSRQSNGQPSGTKSLGRSRSKIGKAIDEDQKLITTYQVTVASGQNAEYQALQRDARKQKLSSLRDNSLARNILEGRLDREHSRGRKREAKGRACQLPQLNPALTSMRIAKNSLTSKNGVT